MNSTLGRWFAFLTLLFASTVNWSQVSTSKITGIVTDPAGALVSGAHVVATNEAQGVKFEMDTTSAGQYSFSSVPPGFYTIAVTKQGFRGFTSVQNALTVGSPLVVDVKLTVGASQEVVEVQSAYERIETTNAQISDVMTQHQVENLPLNGRNPLSLLTLEPGVAQRSTNGAGSGTHVFGSRDRAHNVTIDGIDANESTVPNPQSNIQRITPDNTQEFRTVTLNATAETGRNSGANVMVATRSGTNKFHGNAFWFHRNTALNANEWFNSYNNQAKPALRLHQFGGDIGGPIIKNRTFFFFSYQRSQIFQTEPISATNVGLLGAPAVYASTLRNGIFRFVRGTVAVNGKSYTQNSPGLVDSAGNLLSGVPVCNGSTIQGNCVDSYNIAANDPRGIGADPSTAGLIRSLPLPNNFGVGDGLNQAAFTWNAPSKFVGPGYMARIDHTFSQNDNIFVRYLQSYYNTQLGDFLNARPEVYPGFAPLGEVGRTGKNLSVSWRHTFSPALVNEFTFGFNRFKFNFTFGESNPKFGSIPPWSDVCIYGSFALMDAPNCVSPHTQRAVTTPQIVDNLSWSHGKHTLRAGINFRFYIHNDSRGFFGSQIMTPGVLFRRSTRLGGFNNIPAAIAGVAGSTPNSTDINNLQQAIVEYAGIPSTIQQGFLADFNSDQYVPSLYATVYTRAHQYDFYFQDEWHATRNLTVNAGLRWEYNPVPFDKKATLAPDKPIDGSQGAVSFVRADGWFKNSNLGSIGPRIGLAYALGTKTVVRAGYGLLFDTLSTFQVTAIAGKVPGFIQNCVTSIDSSGNPTTTVGCPTPTGLNNRIAQGFPTSVGGPAIKPSGALSPPAQPNGIAPNVGAFDPNLKNPSIHQWDLTIQRELPLNIVAEVGYVGKRGTHLYRAYDLNQIGTNQAGFLDSFNAARANTLAGCTPAGTGCPAGVTPQAPTLLLSMVSASFLNSSSSVSDFKNSNVGNFAVRVDSLGGSSSITAKGFPANYFRPNPQFTQIFYQDAFGDSYYHGLFVAMRRRFEKGLDFGLSYTLSKSIDDMSVDPTGAATGGGLSTTSFSRTPTDIRNFRLDRALSDFDNRHVLQTNLLWELPVGRERKFAAGSPGWLNQIIGDWQFTGIFTYQSGEPYTLSSGQRTTNGSHVSSALVKGPLPEGNLHQVQGVQGPVMYEVGALITNPTDPNYNCRPVTNTQSYFCIPLPGQNGSGRNVVNGPNFWNLDSGLTKNFHLTESVNLQFRAEFFNILNHPNFENPRNSTSGSATLTSSLFGQTCCVTAALPSSATVVAIGEPNRVIQFGLKLVF